MKQVYYKIFLFYFILTFLLPVCGISQSMNNKFWRPYNWYIGANAGISQTALPNHNIIMLSRIDLTKKNSIVVSIETGYLFSKHFGLSTGIGLSPYFSQLYLDNYSNTFDAVDSENESYERRIVGNNIKENQRIYFIEIPVMLNFLFPLAKTTGFYIQSGVNVSIPVINTYSSSGTYSYSGYYPAYNVTLEDIPYEGFKSNINCEAKGDLSVKTINTGLVAIGGFYLYPNTRYKISLGLFHKRIFSDISDYSHESPFHLSTQENQIRSLMEGSENTTVNSTGIVISLSYFIK